MGTALVEVPPDGYLWRDLRRLTVGAARLNVPLVAEDQSSKAIDRLTTLIDAERLSSALRREIHDRPLPDEVQSLAEEFSLPLSAGYSLLLDEESSAVEELERLGSYDVSRPSTVRCDYYLNSQRVVTRREETCYFDHEQEQILVQDDDTAVLGLAKTLGSQLGLEDRLRSRFVGVVQNAIGKNESLAEAYLEDEGIELSLLPIIGEVTSADESKSKSTDDDSVEGSDITTGSSGETTSQDNDKGSTKSASVPDRDAVRSDEESMVTGSRDDAEEAGTEDFFDTSGSTTTPEETATLDPGTSVDSSQWVSVEEIDPSGPGTIPERSQTRSPTGGGGARSGAIGREGECYVLRQLWSIVREYVDSQGVITEQEQAGKNGPYRIIVEIDDESTQIEIKDVSKKGVGYDIRVSGVEFAFEATSLSVSRIGDELVSRIEVKSTEGESRSFSFPPPEYFVSQRYRDTYYIVRVHLVDEDPTIDRILYQIPEVKVESHDDIDLQLKQFQVEYDSIN